jgi:ribosome-associated translation inhibitor RaiA
MQIQINSDKHISMHAKLSGLIEAELRRILNRFEDQLTRIEVHLSDENGGKSGAQDKRCILEARPRHYPSVTVTNESSDVQTAVLGAAAKMQRLLETTFGRLHDKHRNDTPRIVPDDLAADGLAPLPMPAVEDEELLSSPKSR